MEKSQGKTLTSSRKIRRVSRFSTHIYPTLKPEFLWIFNRDMIAWIYVIPHCRLMFEIKRFPPEETPSFAIIRIRIDEVVVSSKNVWDPWNYVK